jgi:predicted transcriptional regulator
LKTEISSYITIKHLDSLKPLVARQFSNKKMATAAIDTLLHAYYSPSILAKNNLINRDSLRLVIVEKLAKDSIALDEKAIDEAVEKAIDAKNNGVVSALIKTNSMDSMALPPVNIGYNDGKETSLVMHKKDFYNLSADELIKKYKVEGFLKQLVTKQLIKTMKDGKSGVDYFMGKLSWMIILLMPFLAILLELMNRKFYYVEHLIFSFHCHCMVFLVASIMTFCDIFLKNTIFTSVSGGMVFIYLMAYFYFALKNVYQQGWFKTLLKFCFLSFSYLFMLCVFFVLTIVVSFIFF